MRMRIPTLVLLAVSLFGACAEEEPPAAQSPTETREATTEATDDGNSEDDEGKEGDEDQEVTVETSDSNLGEILVDSRGRTLYVFKLDKPDQITCLVPCTDLWPPLTGEPKAGDGVEQDELDTVERPDELTQVKYHDRPLYRYSEDKKAGDIKGQGLGDNWFVVGPDGEPVEE